MNVRYDYIAAGVILLLALLFMRKLQETPPFRTLALAFSLIWASFVALHFWNPATQLAGHLSFLPNDRAQASVGFWLVFVAALLPVAIMLRQWRQTQVVMLPRFLDGLAYIFGALLCAIVFACTAYMTVSLNLMGRDDYKPQELYVRADKAPIQLYLLASSYLYPEDAETPLDDYLPLPATQLLYENYTTPPATAPKAGGAPAAKPAPDPMLQQAQAIQAGMEQQRSEGARETRPAPVAQAPARAADAAADRALRQSGTAAAVSDPLQPSNSAAYNRLKDAARSTAGKK